MNFSIAEIYIFVEWNTVYHVIQLQQTLFSQQPWLVPMRKRALLYMPGWVHRLHTMFYYAKMVAISWGSIKRVNGIRPNYCRYSCSSWFEINGTSQARMFLTVCHFEIHVDSHSYALIIVSLSYRYKYTVLGNFSRFAGESTCNKIHTLGYKYSKYPFIVVRESQDQNSFLLNREEKCDITLVDYIQL